MTWSSSDKTTNTCRELFALFFFHFCRDICSKTKVIYLKGVLLDFMAFAPTLRQLPPINNPIEYLSNAF